MTQEQMINYMQKGEWSNVHGRVYVSFGQWIPEMQELASKIGIENFEYYGSTKKWTLQEKCQEFGDNYTYRLRSDYQPPQPEPEFEYCKIEDNGIKRWFVAYREILELHTVFSLVEFAGYANADKELLNIKYFDVETCKYVVLKKA